LSYGLFGSLVASLNARSHHVCEMKMTTLPEPSSYTTSEPAASAWSRHTLVDFMMRPCALNTLKGMTSMGVVCSNC